MCFPVVRTWSTNRQATMYAASLILWLVGGAHSLGVWLWSYAYSN